MKGLFSKDIVSAIESQFDKRYKSVPGFTHFNEVYESASEDEKLCLKYFYAYMPVSDLAAYDASLFLKIIRHSLMVREKNIFGTQAEISDAIYLNYVLQYRINNENIEFNRAYLFNELYERVKGKNMYDATLEVNYWCLEKATYIGTDPRTVSPLTIIKNTTGRCGEESTFTVSALRSVGIPARQIYTPRWAHCDSNHAWVEVYIDGKWQFLGACEPEPVLNKGWFSGPASRGMLMHTRVFSTIAGDEEVAFKSNYMAELNLTKNYLTPTSVKVSVVNTESNDKIHVLFQVTNHCELSTILTLETDGNGEVQATLGLGDVMLHVTNGSKFVTKKIDIRKETDIVIDFSKAVECENNSVSWKFIPPFSDYSEGDHGITDEMAKAHDERLKQCTDIRNQFAATFYNAETAAKAVDAYDSGNLEAAQVLINAKGNAEEVKSFLDEKINIPFKYKMLLLRSLPKKDLTDCESSILLEHLQYAYEYRNNFYEEIYFKYVLNPRVSLEMVTPYRKFITSYFDEKTKSEFVKNPKSIYDYVEKNIKDAESDDYKTLIAPPAGALLLGHGTEHTRKVLFVAICRTLGIAARLNPQDGDVEYYVNGKFVKIVERVAKETSKLTLQCGEKLVCGGNLSIARLVDGRYQTLRFWDRNREVFEVEEGWHRILTNERLADGSMLINAYYVKMEADKDSALTVEIPKEKIAMPEAALTDFDFGNKKLFEFFDKNTLLAYIEPSKEPTEHLLKELQEAETEIKGKDVCIVLVTQNTNDSLEKVKALFDDINIIKVDNMDFAGSLCSNLNMQTERYPVIAFVAANTQNALYYTSGYNVGSVKMALKTVE